MGRADIIWYRLALVVLLPAWVLLVQALVTLPRVVELRPDGGLRISSLVRRRTLPAVSLRRVDTVPSRVGATFGNLSLGFDVPPELGLPGRWPHAFSMRPENGGRAATLTLMLRCQSSTRWAEVLDALAQQFPNVPIERRINHEVLEPPAPDEAVWTRFGRLEPLGLNIPWIVMFLIGLALIPPALIGALISTSVIPDRGNPAPRTPYVEARGALGSWATERPGPFPAPSAVRVTQCKRNKPGLWSHNRHQRSIAAEFEIPLGSERAAGAVVKVADIASGQLVRVNSSVWQGRATVTIELHCVVDPPAGWDAARDETVALAQRMVAGLVELATA